MNTPPSKGRERAADYPRGPIRRVSLFDIVYREFGHIWFMHVDMDFPDLGGSAGDFPVALYGRYRELFGADALAGFPAYDALVCDYAGYDSSITVGDAPAAMVLLARKCMPQQLDPAHWDEVKKPHGTILCLMAPVDGSHIRLVQRCHGTALKRRFPDPSSHRGVGITTALAVDPGTEAQLIAWQQRRLGI